LFDIRINPVKAEAAIKLAMTNPSWRLFVKNNGINE